MEVMLEKVSKRADPQQRVVLRGYMPRIHEVQAPCQWLNNCYDGKCPSFVRQNGNFYCSKIKARI